MALRKARYSASRSFARTSWSECMRLSKTTPMLVSPFPRGITQTQ